MKFLQTAVFGVGALCLTVPFSLQAQQPIGCLEFPYNGAYLFGIETIRGWACNNGEQVTVAIDGGQPSVIAYGGERADTIFVCGDRYNGFSSTVNWASLNQGEHTVCAYRGSTEIGCATVTVLNLGQEFIGPSDRKERLVNIPERGTILVMQWDPARQRPVVVDVEKIGVGSR
jgi:hypothetical protein